MKPLLFDYIGSGSTVLPFPKLDGVRAPDVPVKPGRHRSLSLPELEGGFCKLEISIPAVTSTDLPELVAKADMGLKAGVVPTLSEGAMGGTYFLRDTLSRNICVVFKPSDEEPYAPNNPYCTEYAAGKFNKAYKGNIFPGFGMYRELVAFALDSGQAGVPPTQIAKVRHKSFRVTEKGTHDYKLGSVQSYVRDIECSAEDMGPGMMNSEDIQRVAILDIRLCNLDRHPGNLLVCRSKTINTQEILPKHPSHLDSFTSDPLVQSTFGGDVSKSCPADMGSFLNSNALPFNYLKNVQEREKAATSPSPRSIKDNGTSPRTLDAPEGGKLRLVPIDHGYCLPHVLHLSETNYAWLYWPQADAPLSENLRSYIEHLDADRDCETVRMLVGAAISEVYLLTLRICTLLLQIGVKGGLTLRAIGKLMTAIPRPRGDNTREELSPLQNAVFSAVNCVVSKRQRASTSSFDCGTSPGRLSNSRLKHSPSESSLLDLVEILSINSPHRPGAPPPRLNTSPPNHSVVTKLHHDDCTLTCPATFGFITTSSGDAVRKSSGRFFESEILEEAESNLNLNSRCTEKDLLFAMSIDGGSTLLSALTAAINELVISAASTLC